MRIFKRGDSRFWWGEYRDAEGIVRRKTTGCREKGAAQSVLSRWVAEAERVKAGIVSPAEDAAARHAARPLGEHLDAYLAALRGRASEAHAKTVAAYCRRFAVDLDARSLRDLTRDRAEGWFAERRAEGMLARSANAHRAALIGWVNWLRRAGRWPGGNPFATMPKYDQRRERVRERRAMTEAEAAALVWTAARRPLAERGREIRRLPEGGKRTNWAYLPLAPDNIEACAGNARAKLRPLRVRRLEDEGEARAMFYRTAFGSGFRVSGLFDLRVADLDAAGAVLNLRAAADKSGRGMAQPIPRELADDLAAWIAVRRARPDAPLFPVRPTLKAFYKDAEAAGIAKADGRGKVVDRHATRKTFITWLQKAGASLTEAKILAGHASVEMTANHYTDPAMLDIAGRVAALPSLRPTEPEAVESRKASGAENDSVEVANHLCVKTCVSGVEKGQFLASTGNEGSCRSETGIDEKAPKNVCFSGPERWSGRVDLNHRSLVPQTSALPS